MTNLTISRAKINSDARQPKYGYYYFMPYISLLAVFLCVGAFFVALGLQQEIRFIWVIGIATAGYGLLTTLGWALARYVIPGNRVSVARRIIADLRLNGSERILDVGAGRGLYTIEAARQLSDGRVCGIDIWNPEVVDNLNFHLRMSQPKGNTIENARKNAMLAGVDQKVEFINMDATQLEFEDRSFDLVMCGFVLGHLWRHQQETLGEILRVLRDDGRMVLVDNVCDLTYFLLSTPHMFVWSYIKGRKARRLSERNWFRTVLRARFDIKRWHVGRGVIIIEGRKR